MPARSPGPILLTIHDVQYRTFPEYATLLKRQYLRLAVPLAVRRAATIAVPSEYVRRTVVEGFGCDPERVVVVPHGVDPPSSPVDVDEVRHRYGLADRRFVVYPAITHPHKNHRFLLELLAGPWNDPDLALVLLGGRGLAEDDVVATIERLGLGPRVVRPGSRSGRRPRRPHRRGRGPRVPVGVRGFRCAPARGDGRGHAGRLQRPSGRAGGRRRCRARAADRPGRVEGRARRRRRRSRRARRRRAPPRRAVHDGGVRRRAGRRLPHVPRPRDAAAHRRHRPALRAGHGADRPGADADRRRAGGTRSRVARRRRPALVPPARAGAGLGRPARAAGGDAVRDGHPCPPVPGTQQARPRPPCRRVRRLLRAGRLDRPRRGRLVPPRRCRPGDVAPADDGRHRTAGRLVASGAAGVQHPGRLPRRGRRDGRHHQPPRDRRRRPARARSATASPMP